MSRGRAWRGVVLTLLLARLVLAPTLPAYGAASSDAQRSLAGAHSPVPTMLDSTALRGQSVRPALDDGVGIPAVDPQQAARVALSQDFDGGSLDVAASRYDPGSNTVYLEPRRFPSDEWSWGDQWWVYFRAAGVRGLAPTFHLDVSNPFQGNYCGLKFAYSYDRERWSFFDRGDTVGDCDWGAQAYVFGNDAPFAADEVYVAYGLPYPLSATRAYVAAIASRPYVRPTISAGDDWIVAYASDGTLTDRSAGGRGLVPRHPLYGLQIGDPEEPGHRLKIVLVAGNHAGEHVAGYVLQGMVDWLLSNDRRAIYMHKIATFYVYPQVDPDGRWAGYFRSTPGAPARDHNRYWHDPPPGSGLAALTAAMRADTDGEVDWFFDFHAFGAASGVLYYDHSVGDAARFLKRLSHYEPEMGAYQASHAGMASVWAASPQGLDAAYSFVAESGFLADQPQERYEEIGRHYALALSDVLLALTDELYPSYLAP